MSSSINPTSIPSVSALRHQLGYGDSDPSSCQSKLFQDSVRAFRKTFKTRQGYEGSAMYEWKSPEHQSALEEMAHEFLDRDGNGARLWPDEHAQGSVRKLKYSRHGTKIKRILKQLFWRMNLQQHRNGKYRKNKVKTGNVHTRTLDGRGSHENPIDVDEIEESLENSSAVGMPSTSSSTKTDKAAAPSKIVDPYELDSTSEEVQGLLQLQRGVATDFQREPEGHGQEVENNSNDPYNLTSSTGPMEDRQLAPYAEMNPSEPPPKRPRVDTMQSLHQTSKKKRDEAPVDPQTSLTSPRKRNAPQRDGILTGERLSEALQAMDKDSPPEMNAGTMSSGAHLEVPGGSVTGGQAESDLHKGEANAEDVEDREDSVDAFIDEATKQLYVETDTRSIQQDEVISSTEASAPVDTSCPTSPTMEHRKTVSFLVDMRRSQTMAVEPIENDGSSQTAPLRQARVKFVYRIITRSPTRRSCIWKPRGSFRTKTLAELENELPLEFERSELKYLLIRLEARDTHADQIIPCGREDEFDALKRHLVDFIRHCVVESLPGEEVSVFIDIEPLSTLDSMEKSSEVEHIMFDW
ncbi:hypothetical protein CABS01_08055 [Colletotrichum abscissum]|uniref:Uncharacterized protein n=1 Tax=Colletotrichum abscissum TaxID=1671311 RepID=A0A9P9XDJ8_9PEZI|nr:uncharacterized protein CABS01_08055 [Colletotrichum abscissum]KAI3547704.1 hypothetical protein CABS02_08516 [Colletotrichum abscissum]KAK1508825.1 hypothetical protein CABS01_08055 [Colletotrichum abscissum]